jgi:hypothetical protein
MYFLSHVGFREIIYLSIYLSIWYCGRLYSSCSRWTFFASRVSPPLGVSPKDEHPRGEDNRPARNIHLEQELFYYMTYINTKYTVYGRNSTKQARFAGFAFRHTGHFDVNKPSLLGNADSVHAQCPSFVSLKLDSSTPQALEYT